MTKTVYLISQLKNLNLLDNDALDEISNIDNDVIGTGLFLNILLSVGALFSVFFSLAFVVTSIWLVFGLREDFIWVFLAASGVIFTVFGAWIYSSQDLFKLRLSSFYILFGKLAFMAALIALIWQFTNYDFIFKYSVAISLLVLIVAIINLYVSKIRLEAYFLLLLAILTVKFFSSDLVSLIYESKAQDFLDLNVDFFINSGLWIWAVLSLMKYNMTHKSRLPFYAFMGAQISLVFFDHDVFAIFTANGLNQFLSVIYNFILLAPSIYLVVKLQKASDYKLSWQYFTCFGLLILLCFIPLPSFFMVLFAFLYGYTQRDRYILNSAYILTPIFIYNLYRRLDIDLNSAALMAVLVGIVFLMAYGIVRFSKFKQEVAE